MEKTNPKFEKYILVCENERESGDCCGKAGQHLRERLKNEIKSRGLASKIRVSRTGCLDVCSEGPNVLIAPDYIWYKHVSEQDIPAIVSEVIRGLKK